MNLPTTVRPSLVRTVTIRLAITSVLAMALQLAVVFVRSYYNEDDLNKSLVTREAGSLLRALQNGPTGLRLKQRAIPNQYSGPNASFYAYRILTEDGRVVAEHNGPMLANLSPWRERPSRTQDLWLLDLDAERKLFVAGGLKHRFANKDVWVEFATVGDPDRVYRRILAAEVLDDVWMPMIPLVVLTLGVAVISVRRSLGGLVRAAQTAEGMSPLDSSSRFDVAGMPREAAILAVAINGLLDRVNELAVGKLPPHLARRQGRHQHEDHQQDRARGGRSPGEGGFGPDDRQPERQDDPHRVFHHSPGRALHAGRPAGESGEGDKVAAASVLAEAEESPADETETLPLQ